MKNILHKLPVAGIAMLILTGCSKEIKIMVTEKPAPQTDTVLVLTTHPAAHGIAPKIWAAKRNGDIKYYKIAQTPRNTAFPNSGDEIIIQASDKRDEYQNIIENITQRKRANEYAKQHTR